AASARVELRHREREPFRSLALEAHLRARVVAAAFQRDDHALAEARVCDVLADAKTGAAVVSAVRAGEGAASGRVEEAPVAARVPAERGRSRTEAGSRTRSEPLQQR